MKTSHVLTSGWLLSLLFGCGAHADVTVGQPYGMLSEETLALGVEPTGRQQLASKVDLLLMLDDSSSMRAKHVLLQKSLPGLVTRLVQPNCVDALDRTQVLGASTKGACAAGVIEFQPVTDLHIGILTSSLGGRGGDACDRDGANGQAHLVAGSSGGHIRFGAGGITDPEVLRTEVTARVAGVGDPGCGLEHQLESVYRFLVQPDPYEHVEVTGSRAAYVGIDEQVLRERAAFLRPDSLLAVVMLTDEDDASVNPLALDGQGYLFLSSGERGALPRATSACSTDPMGAACTSCALEPSASGCEINRGYMLPQEDRMNVRIHRMKQRFGVDPQYPISRYSRGFSSAKVPDRTSELEDVRGVAARAEALCDNPIFSMGLPQSSAQDLCHLQPGPRSRDMVLFHVIAGVPSDLLQGPRDAAAWTRMVGTNPSTFDQRGIDPRMEPSIAPRVGRPAPSTNPEAPLDRESAARPTDLQYACTFPLESPIRCLESECCEAGAADPACRRIALTDNRYERIRGVAYPSIRPLRVAKALGDRAFVSSICASESFGWASGEEDAGYQRGLQELGNRMSSHFEK